MKKFYKFILYIILLAGFFFSVVMLSLICPIPFITEAVNNYTALYPVFDDAVTVYGVLICSCFVVLFIIIIMLPEKSNTITVLKNKGSLKLSKQTIESAAKYVLSNVNEIRINEVNAEIFNRTNKVKLYFIVTVKNSNKIFDITKTIQSKTESSLSKLLAINIKAVDVKIIEFEPGDIFLENPVELVKDDENIDSENIDGKGEMV